MAVSTVETPAEFNQPPRGRPEGLAGEGFTPTGASRSGQTLEAGSEATLKTDKRSRMHALATDRRRRIRARLRTVSVAAIGTLACILLGAQACSTGPGRVPNLPQRQRPDGAESETVLTPANPSAATFG